MKNVLVTGAGGAIGGHLVARLLQEGHHVSAADLKPVESWWQIHEDAQNFGSIDLSIRENCNAICTDQEEIYNLAADMGGMGFIETHKADCMLSVLISTHMLQAAVEKGVHKFFYSSSACVYAAQHQDRADVLPLKESDAYPAMPEDGYGWEKLFTERMCAHFTEERGLPTRVARYHNVYGPHSTWRGGREKAPAALCAKVAHAMLTGKDAIEIWGDGQQTRSFMFVDDCVEGSLRIMDSDTSTPLNLGSSELVTINQLVDIIEEVAGTNLHRVYNPTAPQGVRGRNSDNTLILETLGWEPSISLRTGIRETFKWIHNQLSTQLRC
jgi:nucleoside-diphosphate-sugar epimerase